MRRLVLAALAATAAAGCGQTGTAPEPTRIILQCDGESQITFLRKTTNQTVRWTYQIDLANKAVSRWNPETQEFMTFAAINGTDGLTESVEVSNATIVWHIKTESEDGQTVKTTTFDRTLGTITQQELMTIPSGHQVVARMDGQCIKVDKPAAHAF